MATTDESKKGLPESEGKPKFTWELWVESTGVPVHKGYYIDDLSTLPLGRWEERGCAAAFVQLTGNDGVSETRVTEVPAGATLPPVRLAFDEVVYVVKGRGATTVWEPGSSERKSFEWSANSMFLLPRHMVHQFSNTSGKEPVRLLHYNYLPLALSAVPDPEYFMSTDVSAAGVKRQIDLQSFWEEARVREAEEGQTYWGGRKRAWYGSFFPDMSRWDQLESNAFRGGGSRSVMIAFPGSELSCHMSVFPTQTYKKAHRHGPGRAIVIPAGEGYSIMWEEGKEKVIAPWKPGSLIVPPEKWFHQHFNVGRTPARYLAFHPPMQFYGYAEKVEDRARDQIEYPSEEPWIREKFEAELAQRGLTSNIPPEAYESKDTDWAWQAAPMEQLVK